jgi:hypothetical protein
MQATITFLKTGKTQTLEISEVWYNKEKIVLLQENGGFTSFFHGDAVEIKIVKNAE